MYYLGLAFVILLGVYWQGRHKGYKSAERSYKEYIRDHDYDTLSWLYKE